MSCGKKINDNYQYCYKCNFSSEKVKCEGWFDKPCRNYTTNDIHRCIEHCLNFCTEECTGKRKSTLLHLVDKCCTTKTCCKCGKVLFDKYRCCYNCHTQEPSNHSKNEKTVFVHKYEFVDEDE